MTTRNLILMAGIMVLAFSVGTEVEAKKKPKDVNVVNEPNVNVLNNVDVNVTNDETNPIPVTVQNGNNNGSEKELVEIVRLDVAGETTLLAVFTVLPSKRLVVTDVIISGGDGFQEILRDGAVVSRIMVNDGTYEHSYVSGIEFQEDAVISITTGPHPTNWELRGYLTDVN